MLKVPLDLLATFECSTRLPLPRMAVRIEHELDAAPPGDEVGTARVYALVKCFNLGSLMEAMFGRMDRARLLCEAEIGWLERTARLSKNPGLMVFAFQPWVNLARLDRFEGNLPRAAERLEVLRRAWQTKNAALGDASVDADDWPYLLRQLEVFPLFLRFNWTYENLLCAFRGGAYGRIDEIASEVAGYASETHLRDMLLEARLIAARLANQPESALTERAQRQTVRGSPLRAVVDVRLAELRVARSASALVDASALDELAGRLLEGEIRTWDLAMLQPIVALLCELDREAALSRAATAYAATRLVGDEALEAWFASACADGTRDGSIWRDRYEQVAERSWHVTIRRRDHRDHEARCASIDRISSRLLEIARREREVRASRTDRPDRSFDVRSGAGGAPFASPTLVQGIRPDPRVPSLGTAVIRFGRRRIVSLGSVVDADTAPVVRSKIEATDFADQIGFAAKPYPLAVMAATPVTQYVLLRMAQACRPIFGDHFDEKELLVTVRVDQKSRYVQMQAAHIDWCKGTEFDEDEWRLDRRGRRRTKTFRSLEDCHSIDCVLGGPPTEYFLGEQDGTLRLHRDRGAPWRISAIDFPGLAEPEPGVTGEILYRPPYTIHQFPSVDKWTDRNRLRLFISFDYYAPPSAATHAGS